MADASADLSSSRRRLLIDSAGISVGVGAFGFIYGLSTRAVGLSPIEAAAMSLLVFAGAAQFAALGYIASGLGLASIMVLTALLNARNLVYSATLAPWLAGRQVWKRALMAHFVTDEAFALSLAHFRRLGGGDEPGYWWVGIGAIFLPWNVATIAGALAGGAIPDPSRLGLDILFPSAMAGIAVTLAVDRRTLAATVLGAPSAVACSLLWDPAIGVIAGAMAGALVALGFPAPRTRAGGVG
jgi:4-azaleucine resistance transporter AzlC